jgi:Protein of unknown function (DUF4230)
MRVPGVLLLCLLTAALGAGGAWLLRPGPSPLPDGPAVMERVRTVARLETLEVRLYKKVSFSPEPQPAGALWKDVINWARYAVREPRGRALFFADAQLSVDLSRMGPDALRVSGQEVEVVLPPVAVKVALRPGETEVLGSNLDSQETAALFERAQEAFRQEVEADEALKARARVSAERTLRALLLGLGFREVHFTAALPPAAPPG